MPFAPMVLAERADEWLYQTHTIVLEFQGRDNRFWLTQNRKNMKT